MAIEVQIIESEEVGYPTPAYTFVCPMCDYPEIRNLDRTYVRDETWRHAVARHNIKPAKLNVVVINKGTLEGMNAT